MIAALSPEQQPIAEQLFRGGMPSVRQALEEQNAKAAAEGLPEMPSATVISIAEDLLPRVRVADWLDRAEAAIGDADEIALRDLRAVVASADDVARDESTRELVLTVLAVMLVIEYLFPVLSLELSIGAENTKSVAEPATRAIKFLTNIRGTPWHTFCVLALWLWCGWRCWTERLYPPGGGPANAVRDGSRATDALSVRGS